MVLSIETCGDEEFIVYQLTWLTLWTRIPTIAGSPSLSNTRIPSRAGFSTVSYSRIPYGAGRLCLFIPISDIASFLNYLPVDISWCPFLRCFDVAEDVRNISESISSKSVLDVCRVIIIGLKGCKVQIDGRNERNSVYYSRKRCDHGRQWDRCETDPGKRWNVFHVTVILMFWVVMFKVMYNVIKHTFYGIYHAQFEKNRWISQKISLGTKVFIINVC